MGGGLTSGSLEGRCQGDRGFYKLIPEVPSLWTGVFLVVPSMNVGALPYVDLEAGRATRHRSDQLRDDEEQEENGLAVGERRKDSENTSFCRILCIEQTHTLQVWAAGGLWLSSSPGWSSRTRIIPRGRPRGKGEAKGIFPTPIPTRTTNTCSANPSGWSHGAACRGERGAPDSSQAGGPLAHAPWASAGGLPAAPTSGVQPSTAAASRPSSRLPRAAGRRVAPGPAGRPATRGPSTGRRLDLPSEGGKSDAVEANREQEDSERRCPPPPVAAWRSFDRTIPQLRTV